MAEEEASWAGVAVLLEHALVVVVVVEEEAAGATVVGEVCHQKEAREVEGDAP